MSKRFWFYKLGTDFFDKDELKFLELQEHGPQYILFLMKLMLRSLNDDDERPGRLMFQGKFEYNDTLLAKLTNTDIDVVRSSLSFFQKLGLIVEEPDGGGFMPWVAESVDSLTDSAIRMRKMRESKKLQLSMSHCDDKRNIVTDGVTSLQNCDRNVTSLLISNNINSSYISPKAEEHNPGDLGEGGDSSGGRGVWYSEEESLWYGISDEQMGLWAEAFPGVDVELGLRQAGEWIKAHGAPKSPMGLIVKWLKGDMTQAKKGGRR
jgi:predicted phage replisome organizer